MYWTEIHGGQLLSRPKLTKSCSFYKEEGEGGGGEEEGGEGGGGGEEEEKDIISENTV
jgi:hypothetical protein